MLLVGVGLEIWCWVKQNCVCVSYCSDGLCFRSVVNVRPAYKDVEARNIIKVLTWLWLVLERSLVFIMLWTTKQQQNECHTQSVVDSILLIFCFAFLWFTFSFFFFFTVLLDISLPSHYLCSWLVQNSSLKNDGGHCAVRNIQYNRSVWTESLCPLTSLGQ